MPKKKPKPNTTTNKLPAPLKPEIINIIAIGISIFLAVAIFAPGSGGPIGTFFASSFRGVFGIGSFFLPFIFLAISVYMLFGRLFKLKEKITNAKLIILSSLFLIFITFLHIVTNGGRPALEIFSENYGETFAPNGGAAGAVFGNAMLTIFGSVGSSIILICLILVLLVTLTERSFAGFLTKSYGMTKNLKKSLADSLDTSQYADDYDYDEDYDYDDDYEDYEPLPPPQLSEKQLAMRKRRQDYDFLLHKDKPIPINKNKKFALYDEKNQDEFEETIKINTKESTRDKIYLLDSPKPAKEEDENDSAITIKGMDIEDAPPKPKLEIYPAKATAQSDSDINIPASVPSAAEYVFPSIDLLEAPPSTEDRVSKNQILENSKKLEQTLKSFGVEARVVEVSKGPTVTRYELSPGVGVKVSKISSLADDLALNLAAKGIRIEAPIPGKSVVGIEVPNNKSTLVHFRELIESDEFIKFPSNLAFALGKDIAGGVVVHDIGKMPHLLVAGATGSGKSVCINTLIISLIYKSTPDQVKFIMIDPKVVELSVYNGIPHLLIPVVTDPKKAAGALNWGVREMTTRYELFASANVRDLHGYNKLMKKEDKPELPQIVIIIDELADLMMAAPGEVEDAICRLAQMARAAGLHLIIATQRPSVDVITGVIKANVPSRLAFSVSSGTDSRTILDTVGAEKLLGRGDMLFSPIGQNKPVRVQGAFISDSEVESIVGFLKSQLDTTYSQEMIDDITSTAKTVTLDADVDEFFEDAVEFVISKEKASASLLQRQFRIGYQRASRLIESLYEQGIVGPEDGSKPRKVLMTHARWQEINNESEEN